MGRFSRKISASLRVFVFFGLSLCASCTTSQYAHTPPEVSLEEILASSRARTAAILPFENNTDEAEIGILVRKTFYSHFSPKNYKDVEIGRVDLLLESHKLDGMQKDWRSVSPNELGRLFHTDFLIFGRILSYDKTFLGIYSQIALTVSVEMVHSKTGNGVWRKTLTKRSHEGGIPFSLFGIVPAALRSGFHLSHERTVDLVDRISRELADQIPDPSLAPIATGSFVLQVASFLDRARAENTARLFESQGLETRLERVDLNGKLFHRVFLGPFSSASEAADAKARIEKETEFRPILCD